VSAIPPVERFDPATMEGQLLEAEHVSRYRWAAMLVEGKRVLDAGCGTGYGAELLAREGAAGVVAVDVDREVIEAAERDGSGAVTFGVADLRELPADLGTFEVVVCFEVLEHIDEPEAALDQLSAALAPDGILVVSSPNRDVYPPGNPFHKHEFTPGELYDALAARFAHVRLVRQQDWLAAGLFDDDDFARVDPQAVQVAKALPGEPGKELYSIGLASASPLPAVSPLVMLTQTADVKWWQEILQSLRNEVQSLRDELAAKNRHVSDVEGWLEQKDAELRAAYSGNEELEGVISAMKATRVWRLATRYRDLRDRLLRRSRRQS
jgi:SAM-dependent methyltransferase